MKVHIFSRSDVERVVRDVPHAFISIYTPKDQPARLLVNDRTLGVLQLRFEDTDDEDMPCAFSDLQAKVVSSFALSLVDQNPVWVIHCDAGISRSPAIGGALLKHFTGNDSWIFRDYHPNRRVYRKVLEALENERH